MHICMYKLMEVLVFKVWLLLPSASLPRGSWSRMNAIALRLLESPKSRRLASHHTSAERQELLTDALLTQGKGKVR